MSLLSIGCSQVQSPRGFSNFLVHWVQVCGSWLTSLLRCHVQIASSKESAQHRAMYASFPQISNPSKHSEKKSSSYEGKQELKKKRRKEVVSCCVMLGCTYVCGGPMAYVLCIYVNVEIKE